MGRHRKPVRPLTCEDYERVPWVVKDTQQRKVYRAQTAWILKYPRVPITFDEAVDLVRRIEQTAFFRNAAGVYATRPLHVRLTAKRDRSSACAGQRTIEICANHLRELGAFVVIHEMAHFMIFPLRGVRAHGREFVRKMLALTEMILGVDARCQLTERLLDQGVEINGSDRDFYAAQYRDRYERDYGRVCERAASRLF